MTARLNPWDDPRILAGLATQHRDRKRLLDTGAQRIGWKVGFGAPAAMEMMGTAAPLLGYLTNATLRPSGATVDASDWDRPFIEFEVAVRMGRDVAADASPDQAAAAVDAIAPAIELANIHLAIGPDTVTEIVAGNIFHTGLILGTWDESRAGLDIDGLVANIAIDGVETEQVADLQALPGFYPNIVAAVAKTLGATGEQLRAGDLIITGSVVQPVAASGGSEFTFTLGPLDSISVTLTSQV